MSGVAVIPSKVSEFYRGRSLFVTGATGFMGKVLLHKLLTSSPGIEAIYVLIRPKRGVQPADRLRGLLDSQIFKGVEPSLLEKIVPVAGDMMHPDLGISDRDRDVLVRDVSAIFHTAATVKFDEDFSMSVLMNVQGTLSVVRLAKKIGPSLKAFVHVSTAYSHCYLDASIEEKFYASDRDPLEVIKMCHATPASVLNDREVTKELIGKHPNTYTFTKALAEQIVKDEAAGLPVAIFRPSIVVASVKEPFPGWIDSLNGPTGLYAGFASGLIRSVLCDVDKKADLMPVDFAINLMCAIGWRTANAAADATEVPIYNCTSGGDAPITWGEFMVFGKRHVLNHPAEQVLWYPGGGFSSSLVADRACHLAFHCAPAALGDCCLRLVGKKPFLWKIVKKMTKAMRAIEYFSTREWSWNNDNVHRLQEELDDGDKRLYNWDLGAMPWDEFTLTYLLGIKKFIMKNDPESEERCRKKVRTLYILDRALRAFLVFLLCRFVWLLF